MRQFETIRDDREQFKVICLFVCVLRQELARRFTPQTRRPGSKIVDVTLLMMTKNSDNW